MNKVDKLEQLTKQLIETYRAKNDDYDLKFTLKEIEEIKEKFDTDLTDFELVEVEE